MNVKHTTSTLLGAVLASLCWTIMPSAAQALDLQAVKEPFEELTRQSTQRYPLAIIPLQDQTGATVQALNRYLEGELLQLFTDSIVKPRRLGRGYKIHTPKVSL